MPFTHAFMRMYNKYKDAKVVIIPVSKSIAGDIQGVETSPDSILDHSVLLNACDTAIPSHIPDIVHTVEEEDKGYLFSRKELSEKLSEQIEGILYGNKLPIILGGSPYVSSISHEVYNSLYKEVGIVCISNKLHIDKYVGEDCNGNSFIKKILGYNENILWVGQVEKHGNTFSPNTIRRTMFADYFSEYVSAIRNLPDKVHISVNFNAMNYYFIKTNNLNGLRHPDFINVIRSLFIHKKVVGVDFMGYGIGDSDSYINCARLIHNTICLYGTYNQYRL